MAVRHALITVAGGYQETSDPMALQRALVMVGGRIRQLPQGDTLAGLASPILTSLPLSLSGNPPSDTSAIYASSEFQAGVPYSRYALYDGDASNGWCSAAPFSGWEWNCRVLLNATAITAYAMQSNVTENNRMASSWELDGSNDTTNGVDGTWTLLDQKMNVAAYDAGESRHYPVTNPGGYLAYRLTVTAIQTAGQYMRIGDMRLMQVDT